MVNSGTEATMSALRLARAYTGRDNIVKFIGCYHGHHDSLLVKAGSGAATLGVPDSPGVPKNVAANTITIPFNDEAALEEVFRTQGETIAAVIMEPTPGNMGLVLPHDGYLAKVREITKKYGALLICDEVMSGFRSSQGGSQGLYGIDPDITCLGKVIGGGLPVAAYGGKRAIMEMVAPVGPMYQAGTLSGNPLAMAAGIANLTYMEEHNVCAALESHTAILVGGLQRAAEKQACPYSATASVLCSPYSLTINPLRITHLPLPVIWMPSASTSTACWNMAFTCRPPSSKPTLSRWPIRRKILKKPLLLPKKPSAM